MNKDFILLGQNCFLARALEKSGLRDKNTVSHMPLDYLYSSTDTACHYLDTRFADWFSNTTLENGRFVNTENVSFVHENLPNSRVKTWPQFVQSFGKKINAFREYTETEKTLYFMRYEHFFNMNNVLKTRDAVNRLMDGKHGWHKLIWIAFTKDDSPRVIRLANDCAILLVPWHGPKWEEFFGFGDFNEQPEFEELINTIGKLVKRQLDIRETWYTEMQKTLIPGCHCGLFPAEFTEEYREDLKPVTLTLGAILKDCGPRVREWLAFHYLVGFERFILALDNCSDDTEKQIRSLPFADDIIIHHIAPGAKLPQMGAYQNIIDHYGKTTKWLSFLDDDEFMFGTAEDDVKAILERYEPYGGLMAHWLWFGSNGHATQPPGLVIENYTRRAANDYIFSRGYKTVFRPSCFKEMVSSHRFYTSPECVFEDETTNPPEEYWKSVRPPVHDVIRVNHYKTRSMFDWVQRTRRGNCNEQDAPDYDAFRFRSEDRNEIEDLEILRFAQRVRDILKQQES